MVFQDAQMCCHDHIQNPQKSAFVKIYDMHISG